eukprot:SAG31_NODE_18963_length_616_cov_1.297872_2_plen_137_part_01
MASAEAQLENAPEGSTSTKRVCPPADNFALNRLASTAVSPNFVPPMIVTVGLGWMIMMAVWLSVRDGNLLAAMGVSCFGMALFSLSLVSPYYRRVTRRGGILEELGAGTAMISARAELHLIWSARLMFFVFGSLTGF